MRSLHCQNGAPRRFPAKLHPLHDSAALRCSL
jgi:hypothetical protein